MLQAELAARKRGALKDEPMRLAEVSQKTQVAQKSKAKAKDDEGGAGENPTPWWPKRSEFAQALNEQGSKVGGEGTSDFWWLANAPWFLPPPPEWGPIKPEMYAQYYFKPVHHQYELPNVQQRKAPWFAPNHQSMEGRNMALGVNQLGIPTYQGMSANAAVGPGIPVPPAAAAQLPSIVQSPGGPNVHPAHPLSTMGIDIGVGVSDLQVQGTSSLNNFIINTDAKTPRMGTAGVPGSDEIPYRGDTGQLGGYSPGHAPYYLKDCNPYFPQSCGAFHPGWHPKPPRQKEFFPPHDAPALGPEASKLVPLGGTEAFLEVESETHGGEGGEV